MNGLIQNENDLIGFPEDIEEIANKSSVNILVFADSHGNYDIVCRIVEEFGNCMDAFVFCGDGACDICKYIEEAHNDKKMKEDLPPVLAVVRGNCDSESYVVKEEYEGDSYTKEIINIPQIVVFEAGGRNVFVSHGNNFEVNKTTDTLEATSSSFDSDFVFFGHTHCPEWEDSSGSLVLNPGSCSQPRGNDIPSFAVVSFPGEIERYTFQYYGIEINAFGKAVFTPINF